MDEEAGVIFGAADLRQYVYCARVVYYRYCLPVHPPPTYKMVEGKLQHEHTEEMEHRRTLRAYGIADGERYFGVRIQSDRLGISGLLDMAIVRRYEVVPVEFKHAADRAPRPSMPRFKHRLRWAAGENEVDPGEVDSAVSEAPAVQMHHKYQLAAYALLAEERWRKPARRCFIYLIAAKKAAEVEITDGARRYVSRLLGEMRDMVTHQRVPPPTRRAGRCRECEYRRFCNDVD